MQSVSESPAAGDGVSEAEPARRTIPYQPALDGVRALAVIAVLLFHAEVAGFDGGYLGVSVFFTLSGFLITSLLTAETESSGHVALGRFYARRARRLLPASVFLVGLVVVASAVTDWFDAVSDLRAHVIGSLFQVANWVFLANDGSYQDLLQQAAGAASPLEHYWSLAIEEQFYWLWPIAFVGLWRTGRTTRGRLWLLGGITVAFFVAAPVTASVWGSDAAYWASPARAGEILAGAFLAVVIVGKRLDPRIRFLAPLALLALAVCVVTFPTAGGPAYTGWLPMVGVVSALLLLGLQVDSSVRRACAWAPLVWLGKISYGVYLFHWPIFVVMNEDRMGIDGIGLLALRLVSTLVAAQVSYIAYEQPIRRAGSLSVRPTLVAAALSTAVVVIAAVVVIPSSSSSYWQIDDAAAEAAALDTVDGPLVAFDDDPPTGSGEAGGPGETGGQGETGGPGDANGSTADVTTSPSGSIGSSAAPTTTATSESVAPVVDPPTPSTAGSSEADEPVASVPPAPSTTAAGAPPPPAASPPTTTPAAATTPTTSIAPIPELSRPVRIIVAGDSTAEAFGAGVVNWAAESDVAQAELSVERGCGFVKGGEYRLDDEWFTVRDGCSDWLERGLSERIGEATPDVVMMLTTSFDVLDRRFDGGPGSEPAAMRDRILADFAAITDSALANGAGAVAWIKAPLPKPFWLDLGTDQEQPDRHAVLHSVMDEIAAARPSVEVIDLGEYFRETGLSDDVDVRPDGVHATPDGATVVAADFLGEQLVRAALGIL